MKKIDLGNLILKYDVIYDELQVICDKKVIPPPCNLGDIGSFGDLCTGRTLAKNIEKCFLEI
jgi:hypothetical protein